MDYKELYNIFERRRCEIVKILHGDSELDVAKQHQLYGAVKEIELLLRTLAFMHKKNQQESKDELAIAGPPYQLEGDVINKARSFVSGKVKQALRIGTVISDELKKEKVSSAKRMEKHYEKEDLDEDVKKLPNDAELHSIIDQLEQDVKSRRRD